MTYLYCLVDSAKPPQLRRVPAGLPAAGAVRALDAGRGLWLIAADVPEEEYGEEAIARGLRNMDWVARRALGHEAVVEHFLSARALLPMQLFTIFTSDERALRHVVKDRRRIDGVVRRIKGQHELGVRLTWDEQAARRAVEKAHRGMSSADANRGASYLSRKRDLLDVNRTQLASARTAATRFFRAMNKQATDSIRRSSTEQAAPGSRLMLDAAFLVPATDTAAFRKSLRQQAKLLGDAGLAVAVTGPWPPYNFI